MSRTNEPTADDVILDLLIEGVEPTHERLLVAMAAYPQHRETLVCFFASLGVQSALYTETPSDGCTAERFASIGVSRVLDLRYRRSADADDHQPSSIAPARLSQMLRERGISESDAAVRVGLDVGLMMKLDRRRIVGPRPMEVFRRLGEALDVPPAHVISSATGPPIPSSRGNLRKASKPIQVGTETFEKAVRVSALPDAGKAYWLGLLADETEPKA